jgi:hypothetical protein
MSAFPRYVPDWPFSSFHSFVRREWLSADGESDLDFDREYGERR